MTQWTSGKCSSFGTLVLAERVRCELLDELQHTNKHVNERKVRPAYTCTKQREGLYTTDDERWKIVGAMMKMKPQSQSRFNLCRRHPSIQMSYASA